MCANAHIAEKLKIEFFEARSRDCSNPTVANPSNGDQMTRIPRHSFCMMPAIRQTENGPGPTLTASQSVEYREPTGRVIIVIEHRPGHMARRTELRPVQPFKCLNTNGSVHLTTLTGAQCRSTVARRRITMQLACTKAGKGTVSRSGRKRVSGGCNEQRARESNQVEDSCLALDRSPVHEEAVTPSP